MRVYKLEGKAPCVLCHENADLYIDVLDVTVCRKCGVTLYRKLGEHFVPRSVPNVILRSETRHQPLSAVVYQVDREKREESTIYGTKNMPKNLLTTKLKKAKPPKWQKASPKKQSEKSSKNTVRAKLKSIKNKLKA